MVVASRLPSQPDGDEQVEEARLEALRKLLASALLNRRHERAERLRRQISSLEERRRRREPIGRSRDSGVEGRM